jgi:hypothetical protein
MHSSTKIIKDISAGHSSPKPQSDTPSRTMDESKSKHNHLPVRRRKLKTALYFACWPAAIAILLLLSSIAHAFATNNNKSALLQRRHEWITNSVQYYSTVMRKNVKQPNDCSLRQTTSEEYPDLICLEYDNDKFVDLATKHYYARFLIKKGKWSSAEKIYRRIIEELGSEEQCDNTKLAVSTLLLALHMQRTGDIKATRAVFLNFFRRVALVEGEEEVHKCTCSAKVLQAYALFEMKNGHSAKSLEIIQRAVQMDEGLSNVLKWKQFRDAAAGRRYEPTFSFPRKVEGDLKP